MSLHGILHSVFNQDGCDSLYVSKLISSENQDMNLNPPNQTMVAYFIIQGISNVPELQLPIFLLVLLIYLVSLGGNMTILLLVCFDHHLHTPMYFFLANLSIVDMSSSTITLHKVLLTFISGYDAVPFYGCITQMYLFASITGHELFILAVMSYDRYVAICNPLRYHSVMTSGVCVLLASCCWVLGFLLIIPPVVIVSGFTCYTSNCIDHFFCDMVSLVKLTCSDTSILEILILTEGLIISTLLPLILTCIPYGFIFSTIIKIPTSTGRRKAFYTCSSHLTVVTILYVILTCQYILPTKVNTADKKFFSLFNTAAVPILNPLIYSLKNKDVKLALRRSFVRSRI
ncbi:olfactory receptor 6C4-like [Bufo bufo]|uniref:olfactory receptor 6C4-like n=1 Tax=Bufo bufo TaxID=8384 RepID=UPI001ABDFEC3|nr:olfactory receptor 6C4-like [Bufo bufo]